MRRFSFRHLILLCVQFSLVFATPELRGQVMASYKSVSAWNDRVNLRTSIRLPTIDFYAELQQELIQFGPEAVPELIEILENAPLSSVQLSLAIDAVCHHADPRAIEPLIELANSQTFQHWSGELEQRLAKFGPAIIPELTDLATHGSTRGRARALKTLIVMNADQAEPFCLESLTKNNPWLSRGEAIDYLVEHHHPKLESIVVEIIKDKLENEAREVRDMDRFLSCLGEIEISPETRDLVLGIIENDDSPYQNAAIRALGRLKELHAYDTLVRFLADPPPAPAGTPPPNVCAPAPPQPTRRELAIEALSNFGPDVSKQLLDVADTQTRTGQAALLVLAQQAFPEARSILEKALQSTRDQPQGKPRIDAKSQIGRAAAKGLGAIGNPKSIPVLIEAMDRQPPLYLHDPVVDALVKFGQAAREPLRRLLATDNYYVMGGTVTALCKIGDQRDFDAVASIACQEKYDGYTFIKTFVEWAAMIDSVESTAALWKLSTFKSSGSYALKELARRMPVDKARLTTALYNSLFDDYQWKLIAAIPLCKDLPSKAIDKKLKLICQEELDGTKEAVVKLALLEMANRDLNWVLQLIIAKADNKKWSQIFHDCILDRRADPIAQSALLTALGKPHLQDSAIKVAKAWNWKPATNRLLSLLDENKKSYLPTRNIQYALCDLGETRLIDWLLADPSDYPQYALTRFGYKSTDSMIAALQSHPSLATQVLTSVRDRKAFPHLKKRLDEDKFGREHFMIVTALAESGDELGMKLLTSRFLKPPGYAPGFAWESIWRCPRKKIRPYLAQLLSQTDYESRAIYTLGWFGTTSDLKVLRDHHPNATAEGKQQIEKKLLELGYQSNVTDR